VFEPAILRRIHDAVYLVSRMRCSASGSEAVRR
jgi:hypothetical protein